ncbi:MAG: tetratricopeptide repeat protein [Acidobacteriaceae bacterium]
MATTRTADSKLRLTPAERIQRRRLIVQDTLALFSLTLIAICAAVLTYFFFHSFAEHRSVLEKRWFERGQIAMAAGRPAIAVEDFRSALSFSSTSADYQMALAEALAASGRTEEAAAYFSTLHDAEPGDGYLNLQLARLAVRRGNPQQAIEYYQAALNGLWRGQGTERRLQIRLELAQYLISLGRSVEAQGDLLAAEGNSLDNPSALFKIAGLLRQADDPTDAFTAFRRVERHGSAHPSQVLQSLLAESPIAASMGQYKRATQALNRYMAKSRQHPSASSPQQNQAVEQQLNAYQRMLQLIPFYALPPKQRVERVLLGADIAHKRYAGCAAKLQPKNGPSQQLSSDDAAALSALAAQWAQMGPRKPAAFAGNAPLQQQLIAWTDQAEIWTAKVCGPPTGDDALLLQLAQVPDKTE